VTKLYLPIEGIILLPSTVRAYNYPIKGTAGTGHGKGNNCRKDRQELFRGLDETLSYFCRYERISFKMTQNLVQAVIFLTLNQLILNNRLLFWNKTQFNHDWLKQYIFKGPQYDINSRDNEQQ